MPSPDFLAACRLKVKSDLREALGEAGADGSYEVIYNAAAKQAQAANFGSIAMVCDKGVKAETVYSVLKEMFGRITENSKDRGLNVALKDLGIIVYSPSEPGYLSFVEKRPDDAESVAGGQRKLTLENVEQLSTMIDTISNKLWTGGATLSVRSGYFSNLSVRTPGSRFSKPQSVTSIAKRSGYWVEHRRRQ